MKKILITGGHVTPALALIEELQLSHPEWDLVYIGRVTAIEGSPHASPEKVLVKKRGVRFLPITAGRLTRVFSIHSFISLLKIPVGFLLGLKYLLLEKPDLVVSFGGYIAFPVALAAYMLWVPIVTHEQTLSPGLTNRIIAKFARIICVSFEQTAHVFPIRKTVVTGLPLRKEFLTVTKDKPQGIKNGENILYVTGGATGAVSLNAIIFQSIRRLLSGFVVVHQTGKISYPQAIRLREELPDNLKDKYVVQDYFDSAHAGWLMHHAKLVIGRSGANTVMELAVLKKRAILVPLPWSSGGEQMKNALWLKSLGLAEILPQDSATVDTLAAMIDKLSAAQKMKIDSSSLAQIPRDGAKRLSEQIAAILS